MKHYKNPKLAHFKALQMYLDLVQEIPEVVEVRLGAHDELHTIITGPRDDAHICQQVVKAQSKVMRGVKHQPFLFHLVNKNRIPESVLDVRIHAYGELVWKR